MFELSKYSVEIKINLENGIYVFDDEPSTGKTRLCKLFKEYQAYGEPVIGYTYNDNRLCSPLVYLVNAVQPKVLLLDRYDMYNGAFSRYFEEWSERMIILIDCKWKLQSDVTADLCYINMTGNRISVS